MSILGSGIKATKVQGATDPEIENVIILSHFNGTNGSTTFEEIKGHTLTANNGAALTTSDYYFGNASLNLDGTNDYVTITRNSANEFNFLHNGNDYTFECFLKTTDLTAVEQIIFDTSSYTSLGVGISISVTNNGAIIVYVARAISNSPALYITSSNTITANTWYYLAIISNAGNVTIYIDGNSIGSGTISSPSQSNATYENPLIGTWNNNNGLYFFKGKIDELRISNVARSISGIPSTEFPNT